MSSILPVPSVVGKNGVEHSSCAEDPVFGRCLMIGPGCNGHVRIVRDQAGRATDLGHHLIARIDTERAVNALKLRSVTDIDAYRANLNALIAINTVAALVPAL